MQVNIETKDSVDRCVARLQHYLAAADRYTVSGTASASTVRIIRTQEFGNSIFRPEFDGAFVSTRDGCDLQGNFRLSDKAAGIKKAWFLSISIIVIFGAGMGIRAGYSDWWQLPLAGVGILLLGVLFFRFANYYYRGDKDWIVRQLRSLLASGLESNR